MIKQPLYNVDTPPSLFDKSTHLIHKNGDIDGVISELDLRSQLELFCAKVKRPVTLFSFYDKDEKGDMKRMDSVISSFSLHYCCEAFRICAGFKFCKECDIDHARFFQGDPAPIQISRVEEYVKKQIKVFKDEKYPTADYFNKETSDPEFIQNESIGGFIKYRCPFLGFEELIFPIIVSDLILGVLFCGQIQREKKEDEAKEKSIRVNFLKRKDLFKEHFKKVRSNERKIMRIIKEGKDLYKENEPPEMDSGSKQELLDGHFVNIRLPMRLNDQQYNELIKDILSALEKFKSDLNESMEMIREKYITKEVKNEISSFYQNVMKVTIFPDNKNGIADYWKYVGNSLNNIVKKLSLGSIQVYGATMPNSSSIEEHDSLELVVCSEDDNEEKEVQNLNGSCFKLKPDDEKIDRPFFSLYDFKISDETNINGDKTLYERVCFSNGSIPADSSGYMNILFYPVKDNLMHSSALVINNYNRNGKTSSFEDSSFLNETIIMELYLFSNVIFYTSSYLLDSLLQSHTEMILRFFKHELSHVLFGYSYLNFRYIQNYEKYIELTEEKRHDVQQDIQSTEDMLRAISINIELITKKKEEVNLEIQEFRIFKELLYKWENLYIHEIKRYNLFFKIFPVWENDPDRPLVKSDKRLMEQIVYNIVHNAIKYCYWGTKIKIDCKKLDIYDKTQVLSITDYGVGINKEEKDDIFKLYYRNNDIKHTIAGNGIGLFVVQRIAELLGYKVDCTSDWVSNYNVGVIDAYIKTPFENKKKDLDLWEKLKNEKRRLIRTGQYYKIINKRTEPEKNLTENEIIGLINLQTYEVTFYVYIKEIS